MAPATLDFTDCPYMWPYCDQPLYARAIPIIANVTILNALAVSGIFFLFKEANNIINDNLITNASIITTIFR